MIKQAWAWAKNSNFQHIPSPEEIAALPDTWLTDIFMLNDQVDRQESYLSDDKE